MLGYVDDDSEGDDARLYPAFSSRVQAVVPMYGPHDFVVRARKDQVDDPDLLALCRDASSVEHLTPGDPPTLRTEVRRGQTFAIGWEVSGLGFRPETLAFEVTVNRVDRSLFRRIGEFLRVSGGPRRVSLAWEEPGPDEPSPLFRYLDLNLDRLDPGAYEVQITLRTAGRSEVISGRRFTVRE